MMTDQPIIFILTSNICFKNSERFGRNTLDFPSLELPKKAKHISLGEINLLNKGKRDGLSNPYLIKIKMYHQEYHTTKTSYRKQTP
jgi:hypothetical protein